jgi:hypothetical protein
MGNLVSWIGSIDPELENDDFGFSKTTLADRKLFLRFFKISTLSSLLNLNWSPLFGRYWVLDFE